MDDKDKIIAFLAGLIRDLICDNEFSFDKLQALNILQKNRFRDNFGS